jgi:hypothetical protein
MKLVLNVPKRRLGANVLANPLFHQRVVRDKKKYSRKGRRSSKSAAWRIRGLYSARQWCLADRGRPS